MQVHTQGTFLFFGISYGVFCGNSDDLQQGFDPLTISLLVIDVMQATGKITVAMAIIYGLLRDEPGGWAIRGSVALRMALALYVSSPQRDVGFFLYIRS